MTFDPQDFRSRYRAGISRWYNPWLHGGFVAFYALIWLVFFGTRITDIEGLEWLALPLSLLFFNWGEYQVHRQFGHVKRSLGALFYKRHTGDHHSFFVDTQMPFEQTRDWRVILFPAWLVVIYTAGLALPAWGVLRFINEDFAALFAFGMVLGYLTYEFFHSCEHLPPEHFLARLPWIRHMRHLHALHHRRDLMQTHNFNLVFPLMDWLYGTFYWETESRGKQ